ncbi:hypothetical protein DAPPUDRAFT_95375 [Daphnia pulex]|uniref:Uncharacterized protein n=1 Tax=Daphnia pulex TaxID=6669 RepID=E9FVI7_DAPPU|nr:hypothetical protein DAPPUDRAFT_95375 [Daphnia pulex]|eukprot:EFX88560.1 hypothetical protein DAPPUDRAFT_95375 [Daphnia pulex]
MNRLRTVENVEEANTNQDFDENENENDTDEETQPSNSGNRTQDPIPGVVVATLILIVYAGLMMITGVMVYSAYGNEKIAIEGFSPSNSAINDAVITGICPVDNICPFDCIKDPDACIHQSKPPCTPQVWPSRNDCWDSTATNCPNGGCAPPECPMTTTTEPSIQVFRSAFYENQRVVDLINLYPPHSPNRLEVVTTLLYKTVEQFAMLGHFHRCEVHSMAGHCTRQSAHSATTAMSTLDEPPSANHLVPIFWETELSKMHDDLVTNVYKTCLPRNMDYIFDRIEKMIRPFSLKTAAGDECRVCKDFSRAIFDRCYTKDTRYT